MSTVTARVLARSTLYANGAQLWEVASRVILTPIVMGAIGLEGYGIWTLLFGLCTYVIGLNASVGIAFGKLTAELDRTGEYRRLSGVVSSGMALVGGVAAVVLASIWILHARLLPVLGVAPQQLGDAARALLVLQAATLLHVTLGCLLQVLAGLQRVDLQYRVDILASTANFAVAAICLRRGDGLIALPLGFLAENVVSAGVAWALCVRLRPQLRLSPFRVSAAGCRAIMSLGMRFEGVLLLNTVIGQGIRMIISGLCGTAALGTFHLAHRLLFVARQPALTIVSPLLPAFAHLAAGGEGERWRTLLAQSSKALVLAGAVPLLFAALFADAALFAWTGQRYPEAAWTARVLATAEFATLLTAIAAAGLRAAGTVRLELIVGFVTAGLMLAGVAVGYPLAGYGGMVVAVTFGRTAGALWFMARFAVFAQLRLWEYAKTNLLWPTAAVAPVVVAVAAIGHALPILQAGDASRGTVLLTLLLLAAGCTLACALVVWGVVMSPADRRRLRRMLPGRGAV